MSEFFSPSGESSDVAISAPTLSGVFVPGIDNPNMADGLGIVVPWGSGGTVRKYGDYGPTIAGSSNDTQLRDLSSIGFSAGAGVTYNLEGLLGPQGIPGPPGRDGITTVVGWNNSNFLTALPENLDQINDLGTAVDKLIYTSAYTTYAPWILLDIASAEAGWNDADIDETASLVAIASDSGIYLSSNKGSNWSSVSPGDESSYSNICCASAEGVMAALGDDSKSTGLIWVSEDSGATWVQKEITPSAGVPTGTYLCSGTTDGNTLLEAVSWEEREISLGAGTTLISGVKYAIVVEAPDALTVASLNWNGPNSDDLATGEFLYSNNAGVDWVDSGRDHWFKTKAGAVEKDTHEPVTSSWYSGGQIRWRAQTFTASSSYTITSVILKLNRAFGHSIGDITVSIQPIATNINKEYLGSGGDFLLAATDNGIYLSSDLGDTWTQELPDETSGTNWLSGVCSSTGTYIIVEAGVGTIYRSANSGTTWAEITPAGGDTFTVNKMAISETGEFVLIVGLNATDATKSCYLSEDYGATWTAIYPAEASIEWEQCDISLDGTVLIVSNVGGDVYVSSDSGATWVAQDIDSTSNTWNCLAVSGDGTLKLVANTANNNEVFKNGSSYSVPTWAESTITSVGRALLDDTTQAAQQTTLGLGTGDSPQFTGLTLSGLTANSLVCPSAGGVLASLGTATNGQIPIGSTGAAPVLATITQGTGITVSNTAGAITIATTVTSFTDELAQDAVGGILDDGTAGNIVFTYDDTGDVISAVTQDGEIDHDSLLNGHQNVNLDATPTFAGLTVTNTITEFSTDGTLAGDSDSAIPTEKAVKLYVDTVVAGMGGMIYKYIKATAQAEGDLHLSDGANWAISKALIKYIRVITSSSNWDLYILQNDNSYATNDAAVPAMKIGDSVIGNATIWLDLPYEDEDASSEVHLYYRDNSGANTADIIIQGLELS